MVNDTAFRKSLAKYYRKWMDDCLKSAIYCETINEPEKAKQYLENAEKYKEIICNNIDAINFFSIGDNAFKIDKALPIEFRGYK